MSIEKIQIFDIDAQNNCDLCAYSQLSDIFDNEWLCHNPIETHILYPEHNGSKKCPQIKTMRNKRKEYEH